MKRHIVPLLITLALTHAAIFGAWLGGAEPGPWAYRLAWAFSFLLVAGVALWRGK